MIIYIKGATFDTNIGTVEPYTGGSTTTYYKITYKYVDSSGNTIKPSTTQSVAAGTAKTFSISGAPNIAGYTISSVSPESATINANTDVTYTYNVAESGGESGGGDTGNKLATPIIEFVEA